MEKWLAEGDVGVHAQKCRFARSAFIRWGTAFDNNVFAHILELIWKNGSELFRNQDIFFHSYNSGCK
jgi:hypothetical protein